MTENVLLTHRRNFLVRALGFTVAGASLPVPIVTVASAQDRITHHLKALEQAFGELYAGAPIRATYNQMPAELVLNRKRGSVACALVCAGPGPGWEQYQGIPAGVAVMAALRTGPY